MPMKQGYRQKVKKTMKTAKPTNNKKKMKPKKK